jgi:arsenate reductase
MIRFYHNPRCKKSREGLKYLQGKGVSFQVIEYLKNPLTVKEIEKLLVKLNLAPEELVRTQEDYYRKNLRGRRFTDHEWIRILAENPHLIRRPVVERDYKAVIGDPVEHIDLIVK